MYCTVEEIWDFLIQNEICTENEALLVTQIAGYSQETLNSIIYARTEYHDVEQLYDYERDNFDFSMISGYKGGGIKKWGRQSKKQLAKQKHLLQIPLKHSLRKSKMTIRNS